MSTSTPSSNPPLNYAADILPYVQEPQVAVLKVIECLSGQIEPLTTRQIAELSGVTLSQARGALASAVSIGWVQASMSTERLFLLSPQVAALALNQYAAMQRAINGQLVHLTSLSEALNTITTVLR